MGKRKEYIMTLNGHRIDLRREHPGCQGFIIDESPSGPTVLRCSSIRRRRAQYEKEAHKAIMKNSPPPPNLVRVFKDIGPTDEYDKWLLLKSVDERCKGLDFISMCPAYRGDIDEAMSNRLKAVPR